MSKPPQSPRQPQLPSLRQDLNIERTAPSPSGHPMWVVYDPLQHKFIQIDEPAMALFSIWNEVRTSTELCSLAEQRLGLQFEEQDIERLVKFIEINGLGTGSESENWRSLYSQSRARHKSWFMQVIHNYLFLKVPLFRPQEWLKSTLPMVEPLFTRAFAIVVAICGLAGLYLVSREWDRFIGTFPNFFTLEGAATFSVALFIVKAVHELAHAYTAVRYGCRVPAMGLAVMMLVPMLYTDVSDAWRLRDRRERFWIGAAGVMIELALACIATLLWVFLPEGIARSVVFVVATTSWIMSIGLNLNPLMRFDGYYLLMDVTGIDNLQPRAFALGRWKLREMLFGAGLACPESLPHATRRWMIFYAWLTWIYRLVLFTGIALLVYHYFFKALGIVLFLVEIWFFILQPVATEIADWRKAPAIFANRRRVALSAMAFAGAATLFVVPWSGAVYVPSIVEASDTARVFPTRPGRIASIEAAAGDVIEKGAVLVRLTSPDIDTEIERTRIMLDGTKLRLARTMSDATDKDQRLILLHEYDTLSTKLAGLQREKDELVIRAPIAGKLLELDRQLHAGRWIAKDTLLAVIGTPGSFRARGYVMEQDVGRIAAGSEGTFFPDDLVRPSYPVKVTSISQSGVSAIEIPGLASEFGGRIAVQGSEDRRLVPVQSQFLAEMSAGGPAEGKSEQEVRGVARLSGTPESVLSRLWQQVGRVVVRESGF